MIGGPSRTMMTTRISLLAVATFAPDAKEIKGDGWTLTLNPGWTLRPDPSRVGSYISVRVPAT